MTTFFQISATASDGTVLSALTPDVGTSITAEEFLVGGVHTLAVGSNRIITSSPGYNTYARYKFNPASAAPADMSITLEIIAAWGTTRKGIVDWIFRRQGDTSHYRYRTKFDGSVDAGVVTFAIIAVSAGGTQTVIATGDKAFAAATNQQAVFTANGNSFICIVGGTTVFNTTDSTISAAGDIGVFSDVGDVAEALSIDDAIFATVGAPPANTRKVYIL